MGRLRLTRRLVAVTALAFGVTTATSAFAYFTATGTGIGSARTGSGSANLTVSQVGAGYDSLVPNSSYQQDQCMLGCDGPAQLGDDITLAGPSGQQLVNTVVAFRNWGAAIEAGSVPITFTIYSGDTLPLSPVASVTESPALPAAIVAGSNPSTADVTFDFASQDDFINNEFVYGISFPNNAASSSLNIALSSSANNVSVGSETTPGSIWMDDPNGQNGDFPTCVGNNTPLTTGFVKVITDCGPYNPVNPGAYGTPAQVAAGSADIPAVEVNVVGGTAAPLSPGGPSEPINFAITNPGSSSVHVSTVNVAISSLSNTGSDTNIEACSTGMYSLSGNPVTIDQNVAPNSTQFFIASGSSPGASISMTDDGNNQDNCENAIVNLAFTSR